MGNEVKNWKSLWIGLSRKRGRYEIRQTWLEDKCLGFIVYQNFDSEKGSKSQKLECIATFYDDGNDYITTALKMDDGTIKLMQRTPSRIHHFEPEPFEFEKNNGHPLESRVKVMSGGVMRCRVRRFNASDEGNSCLNADITYIINNREYLVGTLHVEPDGTLTVVTDGWPAGYETGM